MNRLKLAILGNGYLAGIIVDAYQNGMLKEYELVGILGRTPEKTAALAGRGGSSCRACASLEEVLEQQPDIVAEAASVQCVKDSALAVLESGAGLVVLSIGAFADEEFYEHVQAAARESRTKVYIASGAIGGFDVLRTISLMGQAKMAQEKAAQAKAAQEKVAQENMGQAKTTQAGSAGSGRIKAGICTHKGPKSLMNTPLFEEHLLTDEEESRVFAGNAKEAIGLLPTKVNVAVAASLATVGPEATNVDIFSVPGMIGDDHCISAETEGVKAVVDIYSSTSAIAGWSVVAVLKNLVSPVVF